MMTTESELFTLADLLARQDEVYYAKFGLNKITQDVFTEESWSRIVTRFNEKYWEYPINGETLEQWQVRLQVITDAMLPRMARLKSLYDKNDIDSVDIERTIESSSSGESSTTDESLSSDLPDAAYSKGDVYAGRRDKGSTAGNSKSTVSTTERDSVLGGHLVAIDESMKHWTDIETTIVEGYGKAFLKVIWY